MDPRDRNQDNSTFQTAQAGHPIRTPFKDYHESCEYLLQQVQQQFVHGDFGGALRHLNECLVPDLSKLVRLLRDNL